MNGFYAFTIKYNGMASRITTDVMVFKAFDPANPPNPMYPAHSTNALWDTGATKSVLTSATISALSLVPVGTTIVKHAGGSGQSNTYLVNIFLPNKVGMAGVLVSECSDIAGDFGAIIGMDIINRGDFSITNCNGETCMSFRTPSIKTIDYVVEADRPKYAGVSRNAPCPCGAKKQNGDPIKFKFCHGKNLP